MIQIAAGRFILAVGIALLLGSVGCKRAVGPTGGPSAGDVVRIDGSSTVFPITEAVAEEFQKETGGKIKVTVGISGTGGGFKKFCRGATDIQDASRPIAAGEATACAQAGVGHVELPIAYDALTVVINPANTWAATMTIEDLKKIWEPNAQGRITRWNQVRPDWPDQPLSLYGPGPDSGTFDYFTEEVVGKAKASRGDYTASEDDNVLVQGVARDKNALGYFGFAYFIENQGRLKAVAVDSGKGPVAPTKEAVEGGAYPLARPLYIYVSKQGAQREPVRQFVEFYLRQAPRLAAEVKYIPLPEAHYSQGTARFRGK
ncbi:MAG: PstS family phosphate ABC transporter substrate-binding protein [Deltaproteobacteria bacterium]|nr:PstS family phosphate ABC transporter substrate-binding protein [Deltaproteobacteria bacterium]